MPIETTTPRLTLKQSEWKKDIDLIRATLDRASMVSRTHVVPSQVTHALHKIEAALCKPRSPSGTVAAEPELVGEIQRQFYEWWEANQVDPAHGMITQNCALATWHGAYNKYVRSTARAIPPVRGDK